MRRTIDKFKENVKQNVDGFLGVSITEIETGITYITESTEGFDVKKASDFNTTLVKAKLNEIDALGLKKNINDITIKLNNQAHIINVAPNNSYFVYLAVDSKKSNLAVTKSLLNKYKQDLYKTL